MIVDGHEQTQDKDLHIVVLHMKTERSKPTVFFDKPIDKNDNETRKLALDIFNIVAAKPHIGFYATVIERGDHNHDWHNCLWARSELNGDESPLAHEKIDYVLIGEKALACGNPSDDKCLACSERYDCEKWDGFLRKEANLPRAITKKQRLIAYNEFGGHCAYCGKQIGFGEMELDHKFPVSLGGGAEQSNLFCACHDCNQAKENDPIEVFRCSISGTYYQTFRKRKKPQNFLSDRIVRLYGLDKDPGKKVVFYFENHDPKQ